LVSPLKDFSIFYLFKGTLFGFIDFLFCFSLPYFTMIMIIIIGQHWGFTQGFTLAGQAL
jgi:hypothetical protein